MPLCHKVTPFRQTGMRFDAIFLAQQAKISTKLDD